MSGGHGQADGYAVRRRHALLEFTHSQYVGRGAFISDADMIERATSECGRSRARAVPFEDRSKREEDNGTPYRRVGVMEDRQLLRTARDQPVFVRDDFNKYTHRPAPRSIFLLSCAPIEMK